MFEDGFSSLYSQNFGRPAKPIRLMVDILIINHLRNVSDERVIDQWSEYIYYQYLCGGTTFTPGSPCEASELVHFRKRIGESGIEFIIKESIRINGKDAEDDHVNIDTTVQEKSITYPIDSKLHAKIINRCKQIADNRSDGIQERIRRTHTTKGIRSSRKTDQQTTEDSEDRQRVSGTKTNRRNGNIDTHNTKKIR